MSKVAEVAARLEAEGVEEIGPDTGANEDVSVEEPETPTETESSAEGDAKADKSLVASSAPAKPDAVKDTKAKTPDEDRAAARFAALARAKQENLRIIETARGKEQALQEKERALAAREAELEGQFEKAFADPDALFQAMQTRLGIKTVDDLKRYAERNWKAPAKPVPDEEKPLTRAQIDALFAEKEHQAKAREVYASFVKMTDDDEKYPAVSILLNPEERTRIGDRIADEMTAAGDEVTYEAIAEELEKRTRLDPRYAKLVKSRGGLAASKVDSKAGQQGKTAPRIPTADDATERATTNGAGRMSRKERLAGLVNRIR